VTLIGRNLGINIHNATRCGSALGPLQAEITSCAEGGAKKRSAAKARVLDLDQGLPKDRWGGEYGGGMRKFCRRRWINLTKGVGGHPDPIGILYQGDGAMVDNSSPHAETTD